ncbi:MAG TPA: hypothetical protein VGR27_07005, partial [Longimicrobiaceae bacterium]|nr:hypothetical protein [Longimicrobiaceae bacterium]
MRILARVQNAELQETLATAAETLGAELKVLEEGTVGMAQMFRFRPDLLVVEQGSVEELEALRREAHKRAAALVAACASPEEAARAVQARADEWFLLPTDAAELAPRLRGALQRVRESDDPEEAARLAEHLRFEELLYDRFTGFPTLPVMLEGGRDILERSGRLTILYLEFVRYSKLEEIYGWQKLDEVLQSTASAVREFYDQQRGSEENLLMVSHTGDDDFIFFSDLRN